MSRRNKLFMMSFTITSPCEYVPVLRWFIGSSKFNVIYFLLNFFINFSSDVRGGGDVIHACPDTPQPPPRRGYFNSIFNFTSQNTWRYIFFHNKINILYYEKYKECNVSVRVLQREKASPSPQHTKSSLEPHPHATMTKSFLNPLMMTKYSFELPTANVRRVPTFIY